MSVPNPTGTGAAAAPDLVLVPNTGVNRNVTDLNAVYAATAWNVPVVDLNSPDGEFHMDSIGGARRIAIASRTFAVRAAEELTEQIRTARPDAVVGSLEGPVDVLCCYRYEQMEQVFRVPLVYGDGLPVPDYGRFDCIDFLATGWQAGTLRYPLMTSLGCPFGCEFCMARRRKWIPRSPEHCAAELAEAAKRWRISGFQILDDCFNLDEARVLAFCEAVRRIGLLWECNNGLRADRFSRAQADALATSGCRHVTFGVETADPDLLAGIGKGETIEQIAAAIEWAKEAGLRTAGFFLVGLPGSSPEIDRRTLAWAREREIERHFSYFVPPEHWCEGGARFWGGEAVPLSDAYDREEQRRIYAEAGNERRGIRDRFGVVRNTLAMGLLRFVNLAVFVVLTPFLLQVLGKAGYGALVLAKLVVQIGGLATPDFGEAMPYLLPRFLARNRTTEAKQAIRSGWWTSLALAALLPALAVAGMPLLPSEWQVAGNVGWQVVGVGAACAALSLLGRYACGLLAGLQRLDMASATAAASVCIGGGAMAFGAWRWGVPGVLGGLAVQSACECLFAGVLAWLLVRRRALLSSAGSRLPATGTWKYVLSRWLTRAEEAGVPAVDKTLITGWLTMPLLATYHVANGVTTFCRDLPGMLSGGLVPWISQVGHSRDPEDTKRLEHVYDWVNRAVVLLKLGLFCFLAANADAILTAWLSRAADPELVLAVRLLSVSSGVTALANLPTVACTALGHPGLQMRCSVFQLLGNVVLSVALLPVLGFAGILVGSVVAWSASAIVLLALFRRLGLVAERRNPFGVAAQALCLGLAAAWAGRLWSRVSGLGEGLPLLLNGATFSVTLCALAWLTRYGTTADLKFARDVFRMVRGRSR